MKNTIFRGFAGVLVVLFLLTQGVFAQELLQTHEISDKVGQTQTVCGVVAGSYLAKNVDKTPYYINIDAAWPESPFLLVSGGQGVNRLPMESLKVGQPVCATGMIESSPRSGKPYILVMDAAQLKMVDLRVSAAEAVQHVGHFVTITGKVAGASYAEGLEKKPTFLNLDNPFPIDPALIVINQDRRPLFGEPDKSLLGKTISVTGIVQKSESGRAVIDLIWPSQLRVEP